MTVLPGTVRLRFGVLLFLAAPLAGRAADTLVVAVTGGSIRGAALGDGPGAVFKGIPFAAPPLGELRWREPMPVVSWPGVREAVESGPPAMQPPAGWNDRMAAAGSEDCLYLDVWTPDRAPPAPAAVMVWFHGGGNIAGSGGFDPLYDGRPGVTRPLAALRALPAAAILKLKFGRPFTTDGWVFPVSPLEAWRSHREAPVPLLIGANAVEFAASGLAPDVPGFLQGTFGALAPRARALYDLGATPPAVDPVYGTPADQLGSDFFRCVSAVYGEWHTQAGAACWQYQFDRAIPPHAKVAHSGDLPYVFGHLSKTGPIPGDYDATDRKVSEEVETYWTNFAKTGNPNGAGVPAWIPFGYSGRHYLNFTAAGDIVAADNQRAPYRELFRALMDQPVPPPAD